MSVPVLMEMDTRLQCSNHPTSLVHAEQISRTFDVPYVLSLQVPRQTNDTRQKALDLIVEDLNSSPGVIFINYMILHT